ncbi:MAG: hypothetical protein CBB99_02360 [Bacteroidetes bacterium TMED39]|nr:MAG: hypothetical protein CBB99_02360 [Bacteroidetes bacterium TMED39]|tara:strand:- start:67 stop:345 length:279 start_codon:yes stop_codon:yes gene_type:complete
MKKKLIVIDDYQKLLDDIEERCLSIFKSELKAKDDGKNDKITRNQVKEKYKISLPNINKYEKQGIITGYRFGGRVYYSDSQIDSAMKERKFK